MDLTVPLTEEFGDILNDLSKMLSSKDFAKVIFLQTNSSGELFVRAQTTFLYSAKIAEGIEEDIDLSFVFKPINLVLQAEENLSMHITDEFIEIMNEELTVMLEKSYGVLTRFEIPNGMNKILIADVKDLKRKLYVCTSLSSLKAEFPSQGIVHIEDTRIYTYYSEAYLELPNANTGIDQQISNVVAAFLSKFLGDVSSYIYNDDTAIFQTGERSVIVPKQYPTDLELDLSESRKIGEVDLSALYDLMNSMKSLAEKSNVKLNFFDGNLIVDFEMPSVRLSKSMKSKLTLNLSIEVYFKFLLDLLSKMTETGDVSICNNILILQNKDTKVCLSCLV